ncbi:IMPACT family protein [Aspergillus brunneoviolaceus CBS 621.78]|uniref:Impact family protein n=1 Tax=Aspergillus brunneoviolaceus CBS 621.78 TaxID=1450534 RepID=A0ACD1GGN6_9EURO|nr:impact family protein [Aspergillus brunneoviolaceus CBS 621.78]RAH48416.1 impact family protein [Aspergillus brunneoviolaceus CBS 621.78]
MPLTNTDLAEEIEAINAIYDPDTITISSTATAPSTLDLGSTSSSSEPTQTTLKLQIPNHPHLSFLLGFPATYPDTPPLIQGTASTAARGEGKLAVDILASILSRVYTAGSVCLFDLISEAETAFTEIGVGGETQAHEKPPATESTTTPATPQLHETFGLPAPPEWMLSEVITEKKSVFVGRAARVTSLGQARAVLDYLLASEKKVATATHNISAWRIRERKNPGGAGGRGDATVAGDVSIVQDCDDDGETAAGGRLLHLMQLMDVWDVVVVVTRWYGGVLLGPDRFRIINAAGRDALVKGGFVRESSAGNGEGGKKKKGKK